MPAAKPRPGSLAPHESIHLGDYLGSTWAGFRLIGGRHDGEVPHQGEFQHESWRRAFTAGDMRALFWRSQQVASLEHEVWRLRGELARLEADMAALEGRAEFYRRQCRLEARMGLMLAGVSG